MASYEQGEQEEQSKYEKNLETLLDGADRTSLESLREKMLTHREASQSVLNEVLGNAGERPEDTENDDPPDAPRPPVRMLRLRR